MHTHILIPTDGSELSAKTIEYGVALAKAVGARVTGLTVSRPSPGVGASATCEAVSTRERVAAAAAGRLAQITGVATKLGVDCDVVHAEHRQPYKCIIDTANAKGCDLIVMASHGRRGISAIVLAAKPSRYSRRAIFRSWSSGVRGRFWYPTISQPPESPLQR